jgi:UDPglucose 6-dehydrogenase/GDP-mannose 6-dehydrogenase
MKISIIGTGYVGLVTGACLADKGHRVICVDLNPERVRALNQAQPPIHEAGLEDLLRKHVPARLTATTDLRAAVLDSEVTMIAVGTPFGGKEIDLSAVLGAATQIGEALRDKPGYHLVVVKSTVVPGTTDTMVRPALEKAAGKSVGPALGLGMNPEFLSEGEAVNDFLFPDRIVLGGADERSTQMLAEMYAPFAPEVPRLRTNPRTAEMIKYASNSLLAALISFTNELANLGARIGGIDSVEVMRGVHLSQYFRGRNGEGLPPITSFLKAGCGFGGSCLPKDVSALVAQGQSLGLPMPVLGSVLQTNHVQPDVVIGLLKKHWPRLQGRRIAVLGLAFKPGTNDIRESPAFPIMRGLLLEGAVLKAHDPVANREAAEAFQDSRVAYCDSLDTALSDIDAVIVVTPWPEFGELPARLAGRDVLFVDTRRAFDRHAFARYEGIGL